MPAATTAVAIHRFIFIIIFWFLLRFLGFKVQNRPTSNFDCSHHMQTVCQSQNTGDRGATDLDLRSNCSLGQGPPRSFCAESRSTSADFVDKFSALRHSASWPNQLWAGVLARFWAA